MFKLEPLGGFYEVRYIQNKQIEKKSELGLYISEKNPEKSRIVQVVSKGPGMYNMAGDGYYDTGVKVGDLIYINQHAPIKIMHLAGVEDVEETFLVAESDIFAVYMRYAKAVEVGLVQPFSDLAV